MPRPLTTSEQELAEKLVVASEIGHVDEVNDLLNRGADVNGKPDQFGRTALFVACCMGHVYVATLLLDHGAIQPVVGYTPLHVACSNGHVDVARLCLDRGAQVDTLDGDDWTPLHVSCIEGKVDAARLCLERGANIDSMSSSGATPYDYALGNNHRDMAAWLAHIRQMGWTRYLSEPRYDLVQLRALAAAGRMRRRATSDIDERLLDFLFPGDLPRSVPRLPDVLFRDVVKYYWTGDYVPPRT